MVTRKRVRSILTALGLYVLAALLIGYFGVNAFSGNRGLKAKQDIDQQMAELSTELARLKVEVAPLVTTHGDSVDQIAGSADAAVQAAVRREEQLGKRAVYPGRRALKA